VRFGDDARAFREAFETRALREAFDATTPNEARETGRFPELFDLAVFHPGISMAIS